jgi:D-alanyl-lipoteichoic acid acyltransferase DltB (MBOAT superfamily)
VYRGKIQADKNIAKFALFVSFFPQLVQGPISRHSELAHQLFMEHDFDYQRVKFGGQLMLWGLFKKLVIADRAGILVNNVFSNYENFEGLTILITVMIYGVQIYCDFSGGIDVARGIAQVFGIELTLNFARPFFATSLSNFWRRWHITLGSWVRDYVFYPLTLSKTFTQLGRYSRRKLGNNLGKMVPTLTAMIIIFLIIGVWHGPQWKYVFYGLYNGIIISIAISVAPFFTKIKNKFNVRTETFSWRLFQIIGTFFLVTGGRYFTRSHDFMASVDMIKQTLKSFNPWIFFDGTLYNLGLDISNFHLLMILIVLLLGVDLFQEMGYQIRVKISQQNIIFRWVIYLLAIFSIIIFGIYGIGYDAASFIYMGF